MCSVLWIISWALEVMVAICNANSASVYYLLVMADRWMSFCNVMRPDRIYLFMTSLSLIFLSLLKRRPTSFLQSLPVFKLLSISTILPSSVTSSYFLKGMRTGNSLASAFLTFLLGSGACRTSVGFLSRCRLPIAPPYY
jgi:hypothetical protein